MHINMKQEPLVNEKGQEAKSRLIATCNLTTGFPLHDLNAAQL